MRCTNLLTWCYSLVAIVLSFIPLGCGGPQPSAPSPKAGYRDDKVSYEQKPNPMATLLTLGEIPLVEDQPMAIPPERIPVLERQKLFAIEGVVVHPDDRMEAGAVFVKLLVPNPKSEDGFDLANESIITAKGKKGRLDYRVELRIPDKGPQQYVLKLIFSGMPPGVKPGELPKPWNVPFAEGIVKVAGPPKPR